MEEDGQRETLKGGWQLVRRRKSRKRMVEVRQGVEGLAAEVESLWTAACFPSPCNIALPQWDCIYHIYIKYGYSHEKSSIVLKNSLF